MSNLDPAPQPVTLAPGNAAGPAVHQAPGVLEARKAAVGDGTEVRRLLPQRTLRTIGAWCFLDHDGPDDVKRRPGHAGATASAHRPADRELAVRRAGAAPGQPGHGAADPPRRAQPDDLRPRHRAFGGVPAQRPAVLHGVQLWIALPAGERFTDPGFAHHADLPVFRDGDATVTVVIGEHRGERSPATVYSPLVGLEVTVPAGAVAALPLRPGFEHGVLAVDGPASVAGLHVEPGLMAHLPPGPSSVRLAPSGGAAGRFFVTGGEPFAERLVMWWNFVARTGAEIAQYRADWTAGRFGEVPGYRGEPLAAPPLPALPLRPR